MGERTKDPDRIAGEGTRKTASGGSQSAKRKRPPQGPGSSKKSGTGKKTGSKKRPAAKSMSTSSRNRSGTAPSRKRRTTDRMESSEYRNMSGRDIERARRREERLRRVRRQKMIMAVSVTVIVLSLLTILILFLSPARCVVSLSKGDRYARNEEYDKALEAYQEALEINEKSVRAYRGVAGCLRMKDQLSEAEEILYTGWKKTKDKGILRYYNTLLINESVSEINTGNCTQTTVDRLERVLENDPENQDALSLIDICRERLSKEET